MKKNSSRVEDSALSRYRKELLGFLSQKVTVIVDRPIGFKHGDITYPINYGFIANMTAPDGEYQDAYVIGVDKPEKEISGKVIAIIERENDIEDKLVVVVDNSSLSDDEIEEAVRFQEQYFVHKIIRIT